VARNEKDKNKKAGSTRVEGDRKQVVKVVKGRVERSLVGGDEGFDCETRRERKSQFETRRGGEEGWTYCLEGWLLRRET